jgi:hypothetical protein
MPPQGSAQWWEQDMSELQDNLQLLQNDEMLSQDHSSDGIEELVQNLQELKTTMMDDSDQVRTIYTTMKIIFVLINLS